MENTNQTYNNTRQKQSSPKSDVGALWVKESKESNQEYFSMKIDITNLEIKDNIINLKAFRNSKKSPDRDKAPDFLIYPSLNIKK